MTKVRWRRLTAALALVLAGGAILAGGHVLGLDSRADVASVMRSGVPNDTLVYDRTGTVLLADVQQPGSQHTDVPLAAMGRWLPAATVADQDPQFWSEPGVDAGRLPRAAWDGVRGQPGETGSSIVLRLIRLRLGSADGVAARARALALAVRVAAAVPRASILESYLNSLPYGNRAVGVEAAAITYFQIDASRLDLAQASLLAGLPEAPGRLDPLQHLALARQRQRQVLDAMVRSGDATRQQADQAFAEPLSLVGPAALDVAPDIVGQALAELTARYGARAASRGFTVLSTLDWGLQQHAEQALRLALAASQVRKASAAALAAVDPRTGEILALADAGSQYGTTIRSPRNPGNAFRVFAYAAAIASGRYTMVTQVSDTPIRVDLSQGRGTYHVQDYDLRDHGPCQLRDCLGNGLNVPAVLVEMGTGVPAVASAARALGAPPLQIALPGQNGAPTPSAEGSDTSLGLSLTLGGYPETVLQMAAGMGTLAAGGVLRQPEAILRVSTAGTGTVFQARPGDGKRALDAGADFVVSQMLADDASRAQVYGLASPLVLPGRHVAAAAGTSENWHDGWTVGYTPSLATVLWVGSADPRQFMQEGSDGIVVAAPAWHRFMQDALDQLGEGDEWYTPPAGVQSATVGGRQAWFLPGTSPATPPPPLPGGVHAG